MTNRTKGKRRKQKVTAGTKQNLNTIINELSYIIGRKKKPEDEPIKTITDTFNNIDAYIAAISIVLPDIDNDWRLSGSRDSFLRIKRRRRFRFRLLISLAIILSLIVISGAVVAIIFLDNWVKWVVLVVAALLLFLSSTNFSRFFINPIIGRFDQAIPEKFPNECLILDNYVKETIQTRRKL
ncbi:MAG: hypothetical protein FK730_09670 [Asgard group archaeon]|nr:hypothetical protein [Asgard group archaeon]